MENQQIGYCAIVLCFLFAILTILSFLYLYHLYAKVKEEQGALKVRISECIRADQVPAIIETSEPMQRLISSHVEQERSLSDLEKRLAELIQLEHKQALKHQQLLNSVAVQQAQQQRRVKQMGGVSQLNDLSPSEPSTSDEERDGNANANAANVVHAVKTEPKEVPSLDASSVTQATGTSQGTSDTQQQVQKPQSNVEDSLCINSTACVPPKRSRGTKKIRFADQEEIVCDPILQIDQHEQQLAKKISRRVKDFYRRSKFGTG